MTKSFDDISREQIKDMRERRDLLTKAITELEYELAHPLPPIQMDYEAIDEEARYINAFLDECARKRGEE